MPCAKSIFIEHQRAFFTYRPQTINFATQFSVPAKTFFRTDTSVPYKIARNWTNHKLNRQWWRHCDVLRSSVFQLSMKLIEYLRYFVHTAQYPVTVRGSQPVPAPLSETVWMPAHPLHPQVTPVLVGATVQIAEQEIDDGTPQGFTRHPRCVSSTRPRHIVESDSRLTIGFIQRRTVAFVLQFAT